MVECYSPLDKTMKYYGNKTVAGAHFPFNFGFVGKIDQQSTAKDLDKMVKDWMQNMPEGKWANWVVGKSFIFFFFSYTR